MKDLTPRQKEVLAYVSDHIRVNHFPPTIREISGYFGISVKGAYDHVKALEKKNRLKCNREKSRALEVVDAVSTDETLANVPLLGHVAAGRPLFAEENFSGTIVVPRDFVGAGRHFAVRVKGDSMKDAGIMDGDFAIITHRETAENGEIVVAVLDEAFTLKRFYREKNRIRLKAENPDYPPIYTQDVRIVGKLSCVFRKYE